MNKLMASCIFAISSMVSVILSASLLAKEIDFEVMQKFLNFRRLKIKSAEYVAISLLQSDSNYLAKRILEVVVNNESSEFLTYYPQWINSYNRVKHKYDFLIEEIEQKYRQHEHLSSQKDFALTVKHLPYSKVLFDLKNRRSNSIKDSLSLIPRDKLAHLLNL